MANPIVDENLRGAIEVRLTNHKRDGGWHNLTLAAATSESLSDNSITLDANVLSLIVSPQTGDTVYINGDGTASSTSKFPLVDGIPVRVSGTKPELEKLRFYSVAGGMVGILQEIAAPKTIA